jgi:hypothetical protein
MTRRQTSGVSLPPVKEIGLHMSVAAFMRAALPPEVIFFHVPNGEVRDKATAGKLKAMGVLAGVYDFILIWPNAQVSFLEIKVGANGLSPAQVEFKGRARANRCACAEAYSIEQVAQILERWCAAFRLRLRARIATSRPAA